MYFKISKAEEAEEAEETKKAKKISPLFCHETLFLHHEKLYLTSFFPAYFGSVWAGIPF